ISAAAPTMLCIVPGRNATSVEVVNFSGGAITERTVIDPGQATAKTVDDCSGQETATWSADGRRLMLRGTFSCARNIMRVESGVMSIDADGQWVQAQSVKVGSSVTTYVAQFRDTGIALEGIRNGAIVERPMLDESGKRLSPSRDGCTGSDAVNPSGDGQRISVRSDYTCANGLHRVADAEFVRNTRGEWVRSSGVSVAFGTAWARAAAGEPVTTDDVLEVAKLVDATVAEAWFTSRREGFDLTGKELVRLADAGMPSRVIDVLVAVSNPKTFVIRRNDGSLDAEGRPARATRADDRRLAGPAGCSLTQDYCYGMMGLGWLYGADRYYGWSPYGYQYGSRYGYGYGSPFGGGYYGPGYYNGNGPVIVVSRPSAPAEPRGRAVYGQGYTRDRPITYTAPTSTSSGSGGTSSAGSGSSGSSSSGSSSGGGGGRTAIPRPPGE
ncbi:MAG: hypothetical protein ABMA00_04340, partial [Gemmatimonas sp.]